MSKLLTINKSLNIKIVSMDKCNEIYASDPSGRLWASVCNETFQTISEKSASLQQSRFSVHYSGPQGLITWYHH